MTICRQAHDPIVISADGDFTAPNGVRSGTGTHEDPFIISKWKINSSAAHGINIDDTTAHFVIEKCTVTGSGPASAFYGVWAHDLANGLIRNNTISENYYDIALSEAASYVEINGNNCYNSHNGIHLYGNNHVTIQNNFCTSLRGRGADVIAAGLDTWNGIATYASDTITIQNNEVLYSSHAGIKLNISTVALNVIGNTCTNNNNGIYVDEVGGVENAVISYNTCTAGTWGIKFDDALHINNDVLYNTCTGNTDYGICVYDASYNTFTGNIMTGNGIGPYLDTGTGNVWT